MKEALKRKIDPTTGRGTVGELPGAADLAAYQRATRRSWRAIAEDVGCSVFALTQYRDGIYKHNPERIGAKIRTFLEREAAKDDDLKVPFVATTVARRVIEGCALAQQARDITVLYGPAGIGKTVALREFARRTPHAYVVTASPATRGPKAITTETLLAMDEARGGGTLYKNVKRIRERLRRAPQAILVYDEAQHLAYQALEELRALHDATGVAMVFCGTEMLYEMFLRHGSTDLPQLFSRIGFRRYVAAEATREDMARVVAAAVGKSLAAKLEAYAWERSRKTNIRGVVKQLKLAWRIARVAGKPLDLAGVKAVEKHMMV